MARIRHPKPKNEPEKAPTFIPFKQNAGPLIKARSFSVPLVDRRKRPDYLQVSRSSLRKAMLKHNYPQAKYDPDPACKFCDGWGELLKYNGKHNRYIPCICIFLEHEFIPQAIEALTEAAHDPETRAENISRMGLSDWDRFARN